MSVASFSTSNLINYFKTHPEKEHDETALPKRYETVREHVSRSLKDVQATSFTTDNAINICPSKCSAARQQVPWVSFKGIIDSWIYLKLLLHYRFKL